jgi:fumarate reductase flavoprotein subunit
MTANEAGATADVVVVGGGLAGLTVANRVAESRLSVVVLEKGEQENYLCNSRIASGSFNLAHSDPTAAPELLRDAIMAETEGTADPALAEALADVASTAMQWLRAEGAKFIKVPRKDRHASWSMAPPRPASPGFGWEGRGPDNTLRCLTGNLKTRGGTIHLGTKAQRLLFEGDRCAGVEALRDGRTMSYTAGSVVLADGGFQANPTLIKRFISPHPECLTQRNARTGMGDALLMAEVAGALLTRTDRFYGHLLVQESMNNNLLWPYPTIDTLASSAIVIDRSGRRFLDEGIGGVAMTNIIARLDDPLSTTAIFDHALWEGAGKLEFTPPNPYVVSSGGTLTSAADIGALATAIDVPPDTLAETVQTYNAAIESGAVDGLKPGRTPGRMFGVLRSSDIRTVLQPIKQPPFYAIRLCAGLTYTMGGIAIDRRAQVIRTNGAPIPGLYAAGACTGGLEGGPMAGYIGGLCKALSLGYIAAASIAALVPTGQR